MDEHIIFRLSIDKLFEVLNNMKGEGIEEINLHCDFKDNRIVFKQSQTDRERTLEEPKEYKITDLL